MRHQVATIASAIALLGLVSVAAHAADPAVKCESGKLKETAKYASCRLKAEAKAVQTATTPDYTTCEAKFTPKFNGLETKAGPGVCPSEGDEASINARISSDVNDIATLLTGGSLPACGDGVIDVGEECDWGNLAGQTCLSRGYLYAGVLDCAVGACVFDESGCESKLVFVTSMSYGGNLGGIAGADAKCAAAAFAGGHSGMFKAWIGAGGVGPSTSFAQSSVRYLMPSGVQVADDWADLIDGTIDAPIGTTELNTAQPNTQVWTGVAANGVPTNSDCTAWTNNSSGLGLRGLDTTTASSWTFAGEGGCSQLRPLYCFEQ